MIQVILLQYIYAKLLQIGPVEVDKRVKKTIHYKCIGKFIPRTICSQLFVNKPVSFRQEDFLKFSLCMDKINWTCPQVAM